MRPLSQWLDEYGESHQNPANKTNRSIAVFQSAPDEEKPELAQRG